MTGAAPEHTFLESEQPALVRRADNSFVSFAGLMPKGASLNLALAPETGAASIPKAFGNLELVADAQLPSGQGLDKPAGAADAAPVHAKNIQPPRLDHFNAKVTPADHFRWFIDGQVSGSGRVHVGTDADTVAGREADGEKNMLGLVGRMHPDLEKQLDAQGVGPQEREQALREAAHHSAIVELRTLGDAKLTGSVLQSNDDEMTAELAAAKALGVDHENFPMNSHDVQSPTFIAKVVDYVHGEVSQGKIVDIHCYHGTDRTGLIGQAEKVTYDPSLQKLLKEPGQAGVDQVYNQSIDALLASGCDPSDHTEIYQSMRQYLQYLHDGSSTMSFTQVPITGDQAQIDALRDAAASLQSNPTLENYLTILKGNVHKFDPATYSAFYRQVAHQFNSDYVAAQK